MKFNNIIWGKCTKVNNKNDIFKSVYLYRQDM